MHECKKQEMANRSADHPITSLLERIRIHHHKNSHYRFAWDEEEYGYKHQLAAAITN